VIEAVAGNRNVRKLYFGNVSCFPYQSSASTTGAAVLIKVRGGNNISQVVFAECELSAPTAGQPTPGLALVLMQERTQATCSIKCALLAAIHAAGKVQV